MNRRASWVNRQISCGDRLVEYDVPGEGINSLAKRLGVKTEDIMKLDANENFMLPREFMASEMFHLSKNLDTRLYPTDQKTRLASAIANYLNIQSDQVVIGNSSDDILEITSRVFLKEKDVTAISVTPTFVMYQVIASNLGHRLIEVPLRDDFTLDVDKVMDACERSTHVLFLCSPNNPTGKQFPADQVRELADKFEGILIVDEAYVEYAPHSVIGLTKEYENIVVLRTFSKAFGLAGLRIGYAVTNQKIAATLKAIQLPYNINVVSLELALRALTRIDEVRAAVDLVKAERNLLIGNVKAIPGLVPYPSDANFVLLKTPRRARQIRDDLAEKRVLVRCYNSSSLSNYMRVTVGTRQMNTAFVRALGEIMDA